jgi:high-affinity iron transporter
MTVVAFIALRETFEALLLLCIILTFLKRTQKQSLRSAVWFAAAIAVICSICFFVFLHFLSAYIPPLGKSIYEGIILLITAFLILWIIGWIASIQHLDKHTATHQRWIGIFLLSFSAVSREGIEMAMLIHATTLRSANMIHTLFGIGIGMVGGLLLAMCFFYGIRQFSLRIFFLSSSILLVILGTDFFLDGWELLLPNHLKDNHLIMLSLGMLYITAAMYLYRKASKRPSTGQR